MRLHQVTARWQAAPKVKVGLVQANIGIHEKWVSGLRERNLEVHQRLSAELEAQGAELIVWPESSYPYGIRRDQHADFDDRRQARTGFTRPLLYGAVTYGADSPYPFNSALMMDEAGRLVGRFDSYDFGAALSIAVGAACYPTNAVDADSLRSEALSHPLISRRLGAERAPGGDLK